MTTNFFSTMMPLIKNLGSISVNISAHEDGKMSISILPKPKAGIKDEALQNLSPVILSGSVTDLDDQFFAQVTKVTEKTADFFSSVEAFEQHMEEVKKSTEMEKEKKKKEEEEGKKKKKKMEENDKKAGEKIELLNIAIAKRDFGTSSKVMGDLEKLNGHLSDKVQKQSDEAIEKAKQVVSTPGLFS
ncbi:MAG: PRTRC system protein E [Cyclobacteriaceae bacterium]